MSRTVGRSAAASIQPPGLNAGRPWTLRMPLCLSAAAASMQPRATTAAGPSALPLCPPLPQGVGRRLLAERPLVQP